MSADKIEATAADCCASCGKAGIDDVKLKPCPHCDLVGYCSDECQHEHRETHEPDCKKRVADLREELLFKQPEGNHLGDCPICFLPLPVGQLDVFDCCFKRICIGCQYTTLVSDVRDVAARTTARNFDEAVANLNQKIKCPFCRVPLPKNEHMQKLRVVERAALNNPVAISQLGETHYREGDFENAVRNWSRAAELGEADAHYQLSDCYREGHGVEVDKKLMLYHLEEATILGDPGARYNLGCHEWDEERYDRAVRHWIIAANLGHVKSIKKLTSSYKKGHVSKDDFAAALRAHQAALDEMKSPQREKAKEFFELVKTQAK